MNNTWKLGWSAALVACVAFMGCSSDDDEGDEGAAGRGGSAGSSVGGTSSGAGGSATAGSATAGTGAGGKGGTAAGGSGGSGGSGAGTAGAAGSAGVSSGGGEGGAGGSGEECEDDALGGAAPDDGSGGAGGAPLVETAVVVIDNVVVKNGETVVKTWAFADGTDILDDVVGDVGDKWCRPPFDQGAGNLAYSSPLSRNVFSKCEGKPAGSLKNIVPFTQAGQYYKLSIGFAPADWSGFVITADVMLVSGGNHEGACAANAAIFVQDGSPANTGAAVQLNPGQWKSATFTVPASTMVDHLSFNISNYTCN